MAQWQIALVREQGINFAVASVKDYVIDNPSERDGLIRSLILELQQPVVLIGAQRHRLYGRRDIVRFLENVHPSRLPWKTVTFAA